MTLEQATLAHINAVNDYGQGSPQARKAWRAVLRARDGK